MKSIKSVTIHKPLDAASFIVGEGVSIGEEKQDYKVDCIKVGFFKKVTVFFSNGMKLIFRGYPFTIEK